MSEEIAYHYISDVFAFIAIVIALYYLHSKKSNKKKEKKEEGKCWIRLQTLFWSAMIVISATCSRYN